MKLFIITIVLAASCMLGSTLGQLDIAVEDEAIKADVNLAINTTTTPKPTTPKTALKTTATIKKTTATTKKTTAPTTKKTTPPTTKKTTTTTKKPTTTKIPTTQPSTTKNLTTKATTEKPTTVKPTTQKPTAPATTPSPYDLNFAVKEGGENCLTMKGEITLKVKDEVINLDQKSCKTTNGTCTNGIMQNATETAKIIVWCTLLKTSNANANSNANVTLTIGFTGGDVWYMSSVAAAVHSNVSASASAKYLASANGKLFQAQSNHSYTCAQDHSLMLPGKVNITVEFKKITIQPFAGKDIDPVACPSGVNPNPDSSIVPIAVGCALAGLIVIVLIAYLIGRRKGGNRGYQKV